MPKCLKRKKRICECYPVNRLNEKRILSSHYMQKNFNKIQCLSIAETLIKLRIEEETMCYP